MKNKLIISLSAFIALNLSSQIYAQGLSKWMLQDHSLVLPFYNSSNNKYITLLIAYEKEWFACKPSLALLALEGQQLGKLVKTQKSAKKKDKLVITINGETYYGQDDTAVNTYTNGLEIVSFFDERIIQSLKTPSKFTLDIGKVSSTPIFYGETLNSINFGLDAILQSCRNN